VDFYELELNVKGFTSLEESLNDYLSEEILQGENQRMCESCQMRVDATHCTKLSSLPPVLNFQLKRFVFNMKVRS
jgi:ubiquitin carboxyl-terminal hydrolase 48